MGLGYTIEELRQKISVEEMSIWARYADLFGSVNPSRNIALYGAKVAASMSGGKVLEHLPKGFNPDRGVNVDSSSTINMVAGMVGAMGGGVTKTLTMARRKKVNRS